MMRRVVHLQKSEIRKTPDRAVRRDVRSVLNHYAGQLLTIPLRYGLSTPTLVRT